MKETIKGTFGQKIERDTPVKITIRATGKTLEAKVAHGIDSGTSFGDFRIDGLSQVNTLYARDIDVEVIVPPIEPGFYINRAGVIFRITGNSLDHPRLVSLSAMSRTRGQVIDTAISREGSYYQEIREGKTVRIADLDGNPASA